MAALEASVRLVRIHLCYHFAVYPTNESCSQRFSRRANVAWGLNISFLHVTAPNVTEAKQPFYEYCHMGSTHNMKTTPAAVRFSAILSCDVVEFEQQLSVCVDGISKGKATEYHVS